MAGLGQPAEEGEVLNQGVEEELGVFMALGEEVAFDEFDAVLFVFHRIIGNSQVLPQFK